MENAAFEKVRITRRARSDACRHLENPNGRVDWKKSRLDDWTHRVLFEARVSFQDDSLSDLISSMELPLMTGEASGLVADQRFRSAERFQCPGSGFKHASSH